MTVALIMAGGRSQRMRDEADSRHKALRVVLGKSLLERNLLYVLDAGIRDVFIAVSSHEPEVIAYVNNEASELAVALGGTVTCVLEHQPLGTIGAAHRLSNLCEPILVLNVDNLTSIDLELLLQRQLESNAAVCIAVHTEGFPVPLGQVVCREGEIVEYREKPTVPIQISSGAYVLAPRVCSWITPGQRTDIPELVPMAQERGDRVVAYEHAAPWIDINDPETLLRAQELVGRTMRNS